MPNLRASEVRFEKQESSIRKDIRETEVKLLRPISTPILGAYDNSAQIMINMENGKFIYEYSLNNFWKNAHSNRSNEGFLYERYVGIEFEKEGYYVEYRGILNKSTDMGRDLICKKGGYTVLVQCKHLSQGSYISVKEVHQLFGSYWQYALENPQEIVRGRFYTNVHYGLEATKAGAVLGLYLRDNIDMPPKFPVVRCVHTTGLYYLPTDTDYFSIKFSLNAGDKYHMTVKDAEEDGFSHGPK